MDSNDYVCNDCNTKFRRTSVFVNEHQTIGVKCTKCGSRNTTLLPDVEEKIPSADNAYNPSDMSQRFSQRSAQDAYSVGFADDTWKTQLIEVLQLAPKPTSEDGQKDEAEPETISSPIDGESKKATRKQPMKERETSYYGQYMNQYRKKRNPNMMTYLVLAVMFVPILIIAFSAFSSPSASTTTNTSINQLVTQNDPVLITVSSSTSSSSSTSESSITTLTTLVSGPLLFRSSDYQQVTNEQSATCSLSQVQGGDTIVDLVDVAGPAQVNSMTVSDSLGHQGYQHIPGLWLDAFYLQLPANMSQTSLTLTAKVQPSPTNIDSVCYAIGGVDASKIVDASIQGPSTSKLVTNNIALPNRLDVTNESAVVGMILTYPTQPTSLQSQSFDISGFINNGYSNYVSGFYGTANAATTCPATVSPADSFAEVCLAFPEVP